MFTCSLGERIISFFANTSSEFDIAMLVSRWRPATQRVLILDERHFAGTNFVVAQYAN